MNINTNSYLDLLGWNLNEIIIHISICFGIWMEYNLVELNFYDSLFILLIH